jgi:hypothetical protein
VIDSNLISVNHKAEGKDHLHSLQKPNKPVAPNRGGLFCFMSPAQIVEQEAIVLSIKYIGLYILAH